MKKLLGVFLLLMIILISAILIRSALSSAPVNDDDDYAANAGYIRELMTLDAAWSLATLKAYNTPDSNLDQVAGFLPQVREARINLESSSLTAAEAPSVLKNKLSRYLLLIEGKEVVIEHFKSNFAVIRNSVKYLPLAAQALTQALRSAENVEINDEIVDLFERTNSFLRNPDEGTRMRLLIDLSRIHENVMSYPPDIANPLSNFTSHARVLVERKMKLDDSIERLAEQNVQQAGEELLASYQNYREDLQAKQQKDRQLTFLINLGLLALLILLGVLSALFLLVTDFSFSKRLAAEVAAKTEHYEKTIAEVSSPSLDKNLSESLDGMGRMAAVLAHEINTPLGYLGGNLQVLYNGMGKIQSLMGEVKAMLEDVAEATDLEEVGRRIEAFNDVALGLQEDAMLDELPEIAEDMQSGIDQIQHIIDDVKDFTRKDRSSSDWFDIRQCIDRAVKMSRAEIPESTRIDSELTDAPNIFGSPAEINQVLINLINNAAHAIEDAGREKGAIRIKTSIEKNQLVVSVRDNGQGFNDDVRRRIFDPFFTTKDVGKGTGVGLAIVRRIVANHGGKVMVKSIPGKGSNFAFVLPLNSIKNKETDAV
ncbi:MAG: ATP-binding protein [Reinekea sp.]